MTKLKNCEGDKTQKHKMRQNWNQVLTKLKKLNLYKLNNSNCDNLTTQIGTKLKNYNCDKTLKNVTKVNLNLYNTQDPKLLPKISRIRETKHLSTDADSSTDAIGGWTQAKSAKKNKKLRSDFRPLPNKNFQMLDHFFPLLFLKDSESLKILDIQLREGGQKDR